MEKGEVVIAQKVFPRPQKMHEIQAEQVIRRHENHTGRSVELPVPIEPIVESTYGLTVLRDEIPEGDDMMILGALSPVDRVIVLNERHQDLFESVMGPERFTLGHELGHWIYDADPDQLSLDFETSSEVFCYHRAVADGALSETVRLREMNANKFASCLLMPAYLMRQLDIEEILADFRAAALKMGVSAKALRIRLETLGLIDDLDLFQLQQRGL